MDSVQAVSVLHKGLYDINGNTYAYVFKWMKENDYAATGNPRESFIDGIWNKESSNDWLTVLQVPVEKNNENF
ncbi:hypothetical protein ACM26V_04745 [Salipaludibacillus sp. HK11]|uniref:hypothetical protein n=1 Tax=Salipaludibacillus sp. HK11 TaxID=3394320 RepID=UPI0039FDACFA